MLKMKPLDLDTCVCVKRIGVVSTWARKPRLSHLFQNTWASWSAIHLYLIGIGIQEQEPWKANTCPIIRRVGIRDTAGIPAQRGRCCSTQPCAAHKTASLESSYSRKYSNWIFNVKSADWTNSPMLQAAYVSTFAGYLLTKFDPWTSRVCSQLWSIYLVVFLPMACKTTPRLFCLDFSCIHSPTLVL